MFFHCTRTKYRLEDRHRSLLPAPCDAYLIYDFKCLCLLAPSKRHKEFKEMSWYRAQKEILQNLLSWQSERVGNGRKNFLGQTRVFDFKDIQRSGKRCGCLLSYSQAEPGRALTQPRKHLLAEPCMFLTNLQSLELKLVNLAKEEVGGS